GGDPVNATDPTGQFFVDAACNCGANSEKPFEAALMILLNAGGLAFHMHAVMEKQTQLWTEFGQLRIPDVYFYRTNRSWGMEDEIKVGLQDLNKGQNGKEIVDDKSLLNTRGGWGGNTWDEDLFMPVDSALWWFFPNAAHKMVVEYDLYKALSQAHINMVFVEYSPHAPRWPRAQPKKKKEKEVQEIEGNQEEVQNGVDSILGPCPSIPGCYSPSP